MKIDQVDAHAVAVAVREMLDTFRTKDVSEHAAVRRAHAAEVGEPSYNQVIGRYLSAHNVELGIRHDAVPADKRGARWSRASGSRGAVPGARTGSASPLTPVTADPTGLGPQHAGDGPFTARMRFHQSWYRATVLRLAYGTGPQATSSTAYGNMLVAADAEQGRNFVTPEIFAVARARLAQGGGGVEPFRLLHNMLSSQPLCFNLFGPLVGKPERAARLFGSLFPGEIASVREVRIEYAPSPASDYLADRTSFDAFVDYVRPDGARAFIAIETKLTDTFSPAVKDGPCYRRWMSGPRDPFLPEASPRVQLSAHNQLWRNHLLALAMRDIPSSPYAACRSVVVHHPLDEDGAAAVASYRALLRPDQASFAVATLDSIVAGFARVSQGEEEHRWLDALRARYLDLSASEEAWRRRGTPDNAMRPRLHR